MKVKFIVKGENPQPLWIADLQNIPFREGDILDISALRYFKAEEDVQKEKIQSFNGIFKVVDILHRLSFELVLSQNTTYRECIIYLKRQ